MVFNYNIYVNVCCGNIFYFYILVHCILININIKIDILHCILLILPILVVNILCEKVLNVFIPIMSRSGTDTASE